MTTSSSSRRPNSWAHITKLERDATRGERHVHADEQASRVRDGVLGDFDVTEGGDTAADQETISRVRDGRLRLLRVVSPPLSLLVRA